MADTKLTALSALSPILSTDILYCVSDPGGTPASKSVTVLQLLTAPRITTSLLDTNGKPLLAITPTASAVYGLTLTNAALLGTVALGVTAPTQAASTVAGTPLSIIAQAAVAGSANAGAAVGGAITITAGSAARFTSGNADGGDINLIPGQGIGTGVPGVVRVAGTVLATGVNLAFSTSTAGTGFYQPATTSVGFASGGASVIVFQGNAIIASQPVSKGTAGGGAGGINFIGAGATAGAEIIQAITSGVWGLLKCGVSDSATNTIVTGLSLGHQTTGVQTNNAAGLGIALAFNINDTTTADSTAAQIAAVWTTATHATKAADLVFYTTTGGAAVAEVVRFAGNGNVTMLSLAGTGSRAVVADANGLLSAPVSDERLKLNLQPLTERLNVLALLPNIKPVFYNFDQKKMRSEGLGDFGAQEEMGFTHQNLSQVLPQLTGVHRNGYGFVKEGAMTAFLVEVAKAQQIQIAALKAKLEALEAR